MGPQQFADRWIAFRATSTILQLVVATQTLRSQANKMSELKVI